MNMIANKSFTDAQDASDLEETKNANPSLAKLMKAWESKQASTARKVGGVGMVAVSLAACGSSSTNDSPDDDDEGTGSIFMLTTGADTMANLEADGPSTIPGNVFNAPLGDGSFSNIGLLSLQTLNQTDVLVGTDEQDVLNAALNGTGAGAGVGGAASPSITNIEIFNFTASGPGGALDLINSTGYEQLWNINSNATLSLFNVGEAAAIGMDGTAGGTTYTVAYTSSADISEQVVLANAVGGSTISGLITNLNVTDPTFSGIEDLSLVVSDGVRLNLLNSVANIENLEIEGSGDLVLTAVGEFPNLVTLNSTGYNEDLMLDISGSGTLESVLTGAGDDVITAAAANFSADTPATTVDLGAGDNRLILQDSFQTTPAGTYTGGMVINQNEISALDFTLAPVSNVQTLELVTVSIQGVASLALEGVGGLETLVFNTFNSGGNNDFTITGAPETLLISSTDEFEMSGGLFTIEGAIDLTMETTGVVDPSDSDIRINGGLNSTTLETLVINAFDDAQLVASGGLDALASIEVNALGDDASVTLNNLAGDEFGALESVSVSAFDDATLNMSGRAPVQQTQTFSSFSTGNTGAAAGTITFEYVDADGALVTVSATNVGAAGVSTGAVTAANIAAAFNTLPEFTASSIGAVVTITRVDGGEFPAISLDTVTGGRAIANNGIQTTGVEGAGFEAVEDVVVDAGDDATVNLTDVYGDFTVDVTAADTATVTLTNTTATTATVSSGETFDYTTAGGVVTGVDLATVSFATVTVNGGLFGNPDLTTLTIDGAAANVTLSDDLSSFTTLDLTGATNWFSVDASGAEFDSAPGDYVTYLIGGTSSDWGGITASGGDSQITMNAGRETVTFTEADFGTVVLNGFTDGADPTTGDRIDLSQLGFTNSGQLTFEVGSYNAGTGDWGAGLGDVRITDLLGGPEMSGEIIVTGVDVNELQDFNIIYL